jgi:flagellar hook-length control protein FliK
MQLTEILLPKQPPATGAGVDAGTSEGEEGGEFFAEALLAAAGSSPEELLSVPQETAESTFELLIPSGGAAVVEVQDSGLGPDPADVEVAKALPLEVEANPKDVVVVPEVRVQEVPPPATPRFQRGDVDREDSAEIEEAIPVSAAALPIAPTESAALPSPPSDAPETVASIPLAKPLRQAETIQVRDVEAPQAKVRLLTPDAPAPMATSQSASVAVPVQLRTARGASPLNLDTDAAPRDRIKVERNAAPDLPHPIETQPLPKTKGEATTFSNLARQPLPTLVTVQDNGPTYQAPTPSLAPGSTPGVSPVPAASPAIPLNPTIAPTMVDRTILPQIVGSVQAAGANGSIDVLLDPPELGRIEIVLDMAENGLRATLTAERVSTADMIRRHADMLSEQFADAGFENVDLSFAEKQSWHGNDNGETGNGQHPTSSQEIQTQNPTVRNRGLTAQASGLDVKL